MCITENFTQLANAIAESREVPEIPKIILSRHIEEESEEALKKMAGNIIDILFTQLIK
ncbi:hypothetical protein KHA99_19865 [Bacillus sp. FJAT-49825]|uniref:Uncharacterized protein n=1 Tax=Neobacillus rhizophilus TaxID=2833579 RepID=A0A942YV56_9BACI|nr:hypothetical protein [Neobacillus rhizophilus]